MKDYTGYPISVGDTLAVAQRYGNSAQMQTRVVQEIHEDHLVVWPSHEEPKDKRQVGKLYYPNRTIVIHT